MSVNNILNTKFCFMTALASVGNVRLCVRCRLFELTKVPEGPSLSDTAAARCLHLRKRNRITSDLQPIDA